MKNMLCRAQPVQTCRIHHFGESAWTHSMSYSQLSRIPPAAKARVSCKLVAKYIVPFSGMCFTFCMFRFLSILFKMFSGVSSSQRFFCSVIVLLMSTYEANLSDISPFHSSFGDVFPSEYSFHSGWCFYLHSSLGNEEGYSDSPKVQLYKSLEGQLGFLWQTVLQKLYSSSDLCITLPSHMCI